jgi:hypothetical protein
MTQTQAAMTETGATAVRCDEYKLVTYNWNKAELPQEIKKLITRYIYSKHDTGNIILLCWLISGN